MDRMTRSILYFLGAALLGIIFLTVFFEQVPVRTYAVRQNLWGAGGVEEQDFKTGFRWGITGVHKWHFLNASVHFLEFTESPGREGQRGQSRGYSFLPKSMSPGDLDTPGYARYEDLKIRNRDGNILTVDVSVPYHIIPGQAYRIVMDGAKLTYQERVKTTVESVLLEILSEMSNEAIQQTEKRLEVAAKALSTLNDDPQKGLARFHVRAIAVLIRRVGFPPEYEAKLQQKQLFTQKALLDQAETLKLHEVLKTGTIDKEIAAAEALSLAEWEKKTETLRADYAIQVANINAEALQYSKRTRAEADATYQTKIADGRLAIDKAEALLQELRSQALSTTGGQIYVARQAAENLNIGRVTLNTSDPRVPLILDLHRMAEMLLGAPSPNPPALTAER